MENLKTCKNKDCRLFNVVIDQETDTFFDAKLGRLVKFGEKCPACDPKKISKRQE